MLTAVMIGVDARPARRGIGPEAGELRIALGWSGGAAVAWAAEWRSGLGGGGRGLGRLLAQQLVAAGERVLDVSRSGRVRLLQAGDTNKNDPNDALSVAVAALRSRRRGR